MKNIMLFLVLVFTAALLSAQSITSTSSSSSNISISVSSTNTNYSYSAKFDKDKTHAAEKIVVSTLGMATDEDGRTRIWKGKGYSAKIRQGKVKLEMNKEEVTKSFKLKFEDLGEKVSEAIGSVKAPKPPSVE